MIVNAGYVSLTTYLMVISMLQTSILMYGGRCLHGMPLKRLSTLAYIVMRRLPHLGNDFEKRCLESMHHDHSWLYIATSEAEMPPLRLS
mmetsp:Transcript_86570/g.253405  ORF Transcript_86570/g.253405 Transcript_86570/m.253405 type:complete len:89 (+) Transcript_86570:94-360(+)